MSTPLDRDRRATLVRAQSRRNLPDDLAGYRRARMAERRGRGRRRWAWIAIFLAAVVGGVIEAGVGR